MTGKKPFRNSFPLTAASIDQTAEVVTQLLLEARVEHKRLLQIRLGLEEILLRWLEAGTDERDCQLLVEKRLGKIGVFIQMSGEAINPLDNEDFGEEALGHNLLATLGLNWAYQYIGGVNQASLSIARPARLGPAGKMLLCILGALLTGLLLRLFPAAIQAFLLQQLITPIFDTFLGFLSAAVGPMMFFSIAWGICSLGGPVMLGRMGKGLLSRWLLQLCLAAAIATALCLLFFPLERSVGGSSQNQFGALFGMLLAIVPPNFVTPFSEGNTLQIVFLAIVIGAIISLLKWRVSGVAQLLEGGNEIMRQLLEAICHLIPGFIFLCVLRTILEGQMGGLLGAAKFIAIVAAAMLLLGCLYFLGIRLREKVPIRLVFKKLLPSVLLAFATASSSAAFPLMMETCQNGLGIDRKLLNFGIPLGIVVFKPSSLIEFLTMGIFCSHLYQIPVTAESLITMIIIAFLLSVAMPPVPGGALTCFTLLFTQLGIPLEALVIAGMLDMLLDFPFTAFNVLAIQTQLFHSAVKFGMADANVLAGEKAGANL